SHRPRAESLGRLRPPHTSDRLHLMAPAKTSSPLQPPQVLPDDFRVFSFRVPKESPSPLRLPRDPHLTQGAVPDSTEYLLKATARRSCAQKIAPAPPLRFLRADLGEAPGFLPCRTSDAVY